MHLVKIIKDEDGEEQIDPKWCLVHYPDGSARSVCSGQCFGLGEGHAVFEEKNSGKITCKKCIEIVKWFKRIKL